MLYTLYCIIVVQRVDVVSAHELAAPPDYMDRSCDLLELTYFTRDRTHVYGWLWLGYVGGHDSDV